MNQRWYMIYDNAVINACVWNGDLDTWSPPAGVTMVLPEDLPENVDIGWILIDGVWTAPEREPEPDPEPEV